MNRQTQHRRLTGRNASIFLCLSLLAVFFLAGIVLGHVSARNSPQDIAAELHQYLVDYCALEAREEIGRVFLSTLLIYFRYPLMAILCSVLIPGAFILPIISAVFGFFLSYAACCFAGAFGNTGVLLAAAVFGLRCLITLPCFFMIAVPAIQRAADLFYERFFGHGKRLQRQHPGIEWWLLVSIVSAVLLAGALLEVLLAPVLLRSIVLTV